MMKLKKAQVLNEGCATLTEIVFLLLVAASSYPYVYVSLTKTVSALHVPMYVLLNIVMLYSVAKMRFAIKRIPNLFPDENLVVVHVCLFTVTTVAWIVERVYESGQRRGFITYRADPSA